MAEEKCYVACYKNGDWMLITREISTKKHAEKKAEPYRRTNFPVKIVKLDLSDKDLKNGD